MKRAFVLTAILFCLSISVISLPTSSASDSKSAAEVTFAKDVAPIFYKNCVGCHKPNDIAPMSLLTYKDARPWARSIKEKIAAREMPPWSADPHYGDFSNDARLSQSDIDTIIAWVDQGAKEGNPKDMPAVPAFSEQWEIGKPDVILAMPHEFEIAAQGSDDYIYFRVPTGFTEDKWIQAAEFRPGNKRVVHHAVVFIETPEMIAMAKARATRRGQTDNPEDAPSLFETTGNSIFQKDGTLRRVKTDAPVINDGCSVAHGGSLGGSAGAALLCVYAPGRNADIWPEGTAKRVPAGSNMIFQMHYSKTTGKPEKDRTSLALVFTRKPVEKMILSHDVTNFFFQIPAGAEDHEASACYTFTRDVQLVSYMPHMHVRGKAMKYEVVYPDGRRETLLQVSRYNFNWQTLYKLKKPMAVPRGSRLIVTAHFDNSSKNKYNPDPARTVRFGEPTYDEMLVGFVDYLTEKPKERSLAKVDPAIYDSYAGQYVVGPGVSFTISREGDKLIFSAQGQPKIEAYPESETKFFFKVVDAQVTFIKNDKGEPTELVFEMSGQALRARKVVKLTSATEKN